MPIRIYVTGGTFDKEYDMMRGQLYFKRYSSARDF